MYRFSLIRSQQLPVRLVSTATGLWFEWGLSQRAKVTEDAPARLSFQEAQALHDQMLHSPWVAPPSLKCPTALKSTSLHLNLSEMLQRQGWRVLQQAWTRAIIRRFGLDTFKLGLRIFGSNLTLWQLSQVAAHQTRLEARLAEFPRGATLLAIDTGLWSHLNNWQMIKQRLLSQGLNQSAWRWIVHQPEAVLCRFSWNSLGHLHWVNLYAGLKQPLPAQLLDAQTAALAGFGGLNQWLRRQKSVDFLPPRLGQKSVLMQSLFRALRLCLDHYKNTADSSTRREMILEEWPLICDWLLAKVLSEIADRVDIQRGWTYDTLMAHQSYWHLSDFSTLYAEQEVVWPERLGLGHLDSGYEYIELTSLRALLQEAKRMHHCVPSYIHRCVGGEVCLFHIRQLGTRLERATAEFSKRPSGLWHLEQLKGPCNAQVSTLMRRAALTVEQVLNRTQV